MRPPPSRPTPRAVAEPILPCTPSRSTSAVDGHHRAASQRGAAQAAPRLHVVAGGAPRSGSSASAGWPARRGGDLGWVASEHLPSDALGPRRRQWAALSPAVSPVCGKSYASPDPPVTTAAPSCCAKRTQSRSTPIGDRQPPAFACSAPCLRTHVAGRHRAVVVNPTGAACACSTRTRCVGASRQRVFLPAAWQQHVADEQWPLKTCCRCVKVGVAILKRRPGLHQLGNRAELPCGVGRRSIIPEVDLLRSCACQPVQRCQRLRTAWGVRRDRARTSARHTPRRDASSGAAGTRWSAACACRCARGCCQVRSRR